MATLHIGGLSSGYDYESMIAQLKGAREVPITTKETKLEELDYDMGAWSEVNKLATDLTDALDTLRGFELWRGMIADSSAESVVTASAAVASAEQEYTVVVSKMAKAQSIASDLIDTSTDLVSAGYMAEGDVFDIEGQQITVEAGETLSTLRTKINSAAYLMPEGSRVQASIVDNHLVVKREDTGVGSVALSDVTGSALEGLGLIDAVGAVKNENVAGQDAEFSVNGIAVVRSTNTNLTDVVEGMTISLRGTGTSTLDIHPDREAIKSAISDFIGAYNALAGLVGEVSKIDMGDSSNLASKGELYGDSLINSIRLDLRKQATAVNGAILTEANASFTYNQQTGVMDNLSDIGIWTSGEQNTLELVDESRLDFLLENEFDKVAQLFKGVYNETSVAFEGGIASDFYKYASKLSEPLTGDIAKHLESMTGNYDDLSDEIAEMRDSLADYEQQLWDEFTRMEDALSNMKSQTEYIQSMFGSKK